MKFTVLADVGIVCLVRELRILRIAISGVALALSLIARAGAIIYVNQSATGITNGLSWSSAFRTVGDGLNASVEGDEIWVAAGVYHQRIELKKGVSVLGGFAGTEQLRSERNWAINKTVLMPPVPPRIRTKYDPPDPDVASVVFIPAGANSRTRIDGVVISGGITARGGGIYSEGGSPVIANTVVHSNWAFNLPGGGGIFLDTTSRVDPGEPIEFLQTVGDRLLKSHRPWLSVTNIPIYPTNEYSAEVHRLLQVTANLYDAMTNHGDSYPFYPTVFRPVFANSNDAVRISGFVEVKNAGVLANYWIDLQALKERDLLRDDSIRSNSIVFGQPFIIGAKKGYPSFNEVAYRSTVIASRSLQFQRLQSNELISTTNQIYRLGITNVLGLECWNSYTQAFPRTVEILWTNYWHCAVTNADRLRYETSAVYSGTMLIPSGTWGSNQFQVPLRTNQSFLPMTAYDPSIQTFRDLTDLPVSEQNRFPVPEWWLSTSNRLIYAMYEPGGRLLDFVNLEPTSDSTNLSGLLISQSPSGEVSTVAACWLTNRVQNETSDLLPTMGVINQIEICKGNIALGDQYWLSYNEHPVGGLDRQKAIDIFRHLLGLSTLFLTGQNIDVLVGTNLTFMAPFVPVRQIHLIHSYQVNDPMVHSMVGYMLYRGAPLIQIEFSVPGYPLSSAFDNIGKLNSSYSPWGGNASQLTPTSLDLDPTLKDTGAYSSGSWAFPATNAVNVRWLDNVHRGTPWQTIYTGPTVPRFWSAYGNDPFTNATNDWKILNQFMEDRFGLRTIDDPENSPVLVNNTFVLNSATNGGAIFITPHSTPVGVNNIISFNSSGIVNAGAGTAQFNHNLVFGNGSADYVGLVPGSDDIALDPSFMDVARGNVSLRPGSPCLDGSSDSILKPGWLLPDDQYRRYGPSIDLGAIEGLPSQAPLLENIMIASNAGIQFGLVGFTSQRYRIDVSTDLVRWSAVATNLATNGVQVFNVNTSGTQPVQFYRAVWMNP